MTFFTFGMIFYEFNMVTLALQHKNILLNESYEQDA